MKRWLASVAGGMGLLYTLLTFGASGCVFMQPTEPGHAHHSPSHVAHSVLCAWSCQANPIETIHAGVPILAYIVLVTTQFLINTSPSAVLLSLVSRSRAPPV